MESVTRKDGNRRAKRTSMEKIENREALHICFTKRRQGMFKKAGELAVVCGAQISVVTLSPGGRPFSFGYPSTEAVIDRYLDSASHQIPVPIDTRLQVQCLKCKLEERSGGGFWWEAPIDGLQLDELAVMKDAIQELHRLILKKATKPTAASEVVLNGSYYLPASTFPALGSNLEGVYH